jgi:IPT/TIG domain
MGVLSGGADEVLRKAVLVLLGFAALVGIAAAVPPARASATYQIPATIAGDCSVDVTSPILNWIASVPNGSTLSFDPSGCYRIEGTLEIQGRSGLTLEGNGALFRSLNPPTDQRAIWRLIGSTGMVMRDMIIIGSYANGGKLDASLQHAHAIDLRGTNAEVADVAMSNVAGDCVYFGLGYDNITRSSGSVHDSTCTGTSRNAVSVTAGDNILVRHLTTNRIGFTVFDVEPNSGSGKWGSSGVTFDSNTIGSYYLYAFSLVEQAPISNQAFTNNTVSGAVLRIGAVQDQGFRPQNVTITGNSSNVATSAPAMQFVDVDGLTVTGNTVPMTSGVMASVTGSCSVNITGNSYPGGSAQAAISPYSACSTAAPSIGSVSPASGAVGTTVAINGSGLSGASAVAFGAKSASFTVNSASQITANVPNGASTGPISVNTPGGTATSPTSFVVTTPTTTTTSTTTTSTTTTTIQTTTSSTATAPTTTTATTTTSTATTTSAAVSPSIGSFDPNSGLPGTMVTISGSGFTGATSVSFNGTPATFTVSSDGQIVATAPSDADSGNITVTTPGGSATSQKRYRFSNH